MSRPRVRNYRAGVSPRVASLQKAEIVYDGNSVQRAPRRRRVLIGKKNNVLIQVGLGTPTVKHLQKSLPR